MALLPQDQRSQIMLVLVLAAGAGGYFFWNYVHAPTSEKIAATSAQIDTLDSIVRQAKAELAAGSVEALRLKVDEYRAALVLLRRLVPERNEVPALIDDISNRAKVRGVHVGKIEPLALEPGQPFDTHRYRLEVYGHYDQVGEFLTDVASLARIIVPYDVMLRPAQQGAQKLLGDTVGGLLEAAFSIRTYVKAAPPPGAGGNPSARP